MRSLLLGVVALVWLFLGYLYWNTQKNCCAGNSSSTIGMMDDKGAAESDNPANSATAVTASESTKKASGPILFRYGSNSTILGDDWGAYKNQLLAGLKDDQLLQITGNYTSDETAPAGFANMGEARADETRKALGLSTDKVQLKGVLSDQGVSKDDPYEAVSFRNITVTKSIDESIENKTIIRFPYNSTNKLNDNSVEIYLDKVAKRVIASGERVRLTGHTDSDGSDASNLALGQKRANVIRDYLVSKGVSPSKIISDSKGETAPVADNNTANGKALNRRTELEIIK